MPGTKAVDSGPPVRLAFREICRSETPKRFPVPLGHSLGGVPLRKDGLDQRDLTRKVLGLRQEPKRKVLGVRQEEQRNGLSFQEDQRNGRVLQEQQRKP